MSTVSDNLETLRAYPLASPGSVAQENVDKLRLISPSSRFQIPTDFDLYMDYFGSPTVANRAAIMDSYTLT